MTAPVTDRVTRVLPDLPPENPRAGRRRVLYLAGLLPLLVALAFAFKVVTMRHHDGAGAAAWHAHNGTKALEEYSANRSVNLLQPWLAPFDAGDSAFLLSDYPRARDLFTTALDSVPHKQECTVRINLALADEAIGDAASKAGQADDAKNAWQAGVDALDQRDCPKHAGLGATQSKDAATVRERLEKKLNPPPQQPQQPQQPQKQPKGGQSKGQDKKKQQQEQKKKQRQQRKLQQRNDSGSREHDDAKDFDDYVGPSDEYSW